MLSMMELEDWLVDRTAEKAVIYHVGHLARDRLVHEMVDGKLVAIELEPLHSIALRLFALEEQGKVLLFQHRVKAHVWEYIALRKGKRWDGHVPFKGPAGPTQWEILDAERCD